MISDLNIKVNLHQDEKGRLSIRISGNTRNGGRFGKELQFPKEGCSLEQFEQFLLETKYEALNPPHFNIPPSEPHPKWAELENWRPKFVVQEDVGLEFPGLYFSDFSLSLKPENFNPDTEGLVPLQAHDKLILSTDPMQVIVIKGMVTEGIYNVGYVTRNGKAFLDPAKLSKGAVWELIHFPAGEPVKRFLSSEQE